MILAIEARVPAKSRRRLSAKEVLVPAHLCAADGALPLQKLLLAARADQVPAWCKCDDGASLQAHRALVGEVGLGLARSWACCLWLREGHGNADLVNFFARDMRVGLASAHACVLACHSGPVPRGRSPICTLGINSERNFDSDSLAQGGLGMPVERLQETEFHVLSIIIVSMQVIANLKDMAATGLVAQGRRHTLSLKLSHHVEDRLITALLAICLSLQLRRVQLFPEGHGV
mmetsp:Transcript_80163/g.194383  ORF Transcript_80163/g.194383 Transcript_80163/m.194383 type:complete len:232 (-) Transcript_80163:49-744(-)